MKINKWIMLMGGVALLAGCKEEYDLPDQPLSQYINVYMPQAVNNPVSKTLGIADTAQTIVFGACYGGQDYPTGNVAVKFKLSPELIDSFNTANGTSYEMLPAIGYDLSGLEATIPAGKVNTEPMKISVRTTGSNAIKALRTYVLPLSIESAGLKINPTLRTTFYVIQALPKLEDYPDYDRSLWSIAGFSSEEANGEGAGNGQAINTIDDDKNTFWHSQWQGASPAAPHHIIYDMGETKEVHGISFLGRQNNGSGKPSSVTVETSLDNVTWEVAGTMALENNQNLQRKFLAEFKQARYIKVTINAAFSASFSSMAELWAF
ncbi:DUF1735 domain-containing protein [Chitinophaga horti]|uniref:DUF1735 domain-containing protein n=1 Tax=Chitinophaga horti TaxID=2920382 RepID=A0ABY6J8W9_9BACT|nr:DUF1735 domain-containing protein [Chitinophaga horti]UYQ95935.1 DUF1735 domain-containing protein [Chitinophaga horti]